MNVRVSALLVNREQPDFIHKIHFRQLVIYKINILNWYKRIDIKKKVFKIKMLYVFVNKNAYIFW